MTYRSGGSENAESVFFEREKENFFQRPDQIKLNCSCCLQKFVTWPWRHVTVDIATASGSRFESRLGTYKVLSEIIAFVLCIIDLLCIVCVRVY
jgi:hypothetical protein